MTSRIKINDVAAALRDHAEQQLSAVVKERSDMLQGVYDRVLAAAEGKSADEIKISLAAEFRSTFGSELTEPDLSKAANVLAEGRRIEVRPEIRR